MDVRILNIIQVIRIEGVRGLGTREDPLRTVIQYWLMDGTLLKEEDPCQS